MTIYLVRHGESTSDINQKYDGDYDDHLTKQGCLDAQIVADKLSNKMVTKIFTSTRIRAVETGTIIGAKLDLPITPLAQLCEQDIYNAFKTLGKNQPEEEYRQLGEIQITRDNAPAGTEAYEDFSERVLQCFSSIVNDHATNLVIVTHGGPIRCILRDLAKITTIKKIGNGAIIELSDQDQEIRLISMDGAY